MQGEVNYPAYKAGHLGQKKNSIASVSLWAAIHPRSQNGVFWQIFINQPITCTGLNRLLGNYTNRNKRGGFFRTLFLFHKRLY